MASKSPISPQLGFLFEVKPEGPPTQSKPRSATRRTWTVQQIVEQARELVEAEFGDVWVEGEISNCRPASSGHCYFTLKDAEAQLPVVLFRRQAMLLRFKPEDGLHVRVRGKVSVYGQRGQLQLIAETLEPVGSGSLQLAFEQLRDKLKAEGLFDPERKRALPAFPRTVAIITSPTGAVIRDFLSIVGRRHSGLSVVVVPVAVQGDNAAPDIEFALLRTNELELADVIVVARGGGSLEDLAAFNSERVARAIAQSKLPVVSAVGHETDFTIADFTADLRAPTPSAAAELITEAQHRVEELIASLSHRLVRATRFQMLQSRQRLARLPIAYAQQRVITMMHRREQHLDDLSFRMDAAIDRFVRSRLQTVTAAEAVVRKHDPRQKLSGASSTLQSFMTRFEHSTERRLQGFSQRCQTLEARLYRAARVHTASRRAAYANIAARLQSLSPLAVLHRGYALVLDERGGVVRSIAQLTAGQTLRTRIADGSFSSQVVGFKTEEATPASGSQIGKTTLKSSRKQKGKPTSA